MLEVTCRGCGHAEVVANEVRGRRVRCRHCDREQRAYGKPLNEPAPAGTLEFRDEPLPDRERWARVHSKERKRELERRDWRNHLSPTERFWKDRQHETGGVLAVVFFALTVHIELVGDFGFFTHPIFLFVVLPIVFGMSARWAYQYWREVIEGHMENTPSGH